MQTRQVFSVLATDLRESLFAVTQLSLVRRRSMALCMPISTGRLLARIEMWISAKGSIRETPNGSSLRFQ